MRYSFFITNILSKTSIFIKLTKNLETIVISLWNSYSIKKITNTQYDVTDLNHEMVKNTKT